MRKIIHFIDMTLDRGQNIALISLEKYNGQIPFPSILAVREDGHLKGSIGNKATESIIAELALKALKTMQSTPFENKDHRLKGFICCIQAKPQLIIFGANEITQHLVLMASASGFRIVVINENTNPPNLSVEAKIIHGQPDAIATNITITSNDYVVIMTDNHAHDPQILQRVITSPAAYIGLLGSTRRISITIEKMREAKIAEHYIKQIYAPIGLNIADHSAEEIAVAILAEVLAIKNQHINVLHARNQIPLFNT